MQTNLLFLPLLLTLLTAIFALFARRRIILQRVISLVGNTLLLLSGLAILLAVLENGHLVSQVGNWPAPFGITLVADRFSALMLLITGLMGLLTAIYGVVEVGIEREGLGYHSLYNFLLMGVSGAFLTGDLFNLFVWFEVMLISSFVLLALAGERIQMEGALKYVAINLIASAFFLSAVALLYGLAGTLNMADLALVLPLLENPALLNAVAMLFLIAFGIKSAIFPLFFWLPASYHTPPVTVTVVFSALLSKVGVYSLIRIFTLVFTPEVVAIDALLLTLSMLTMLTGVLGAVAQTEMRRLLAFHIISQIGYLIMGLSLRTPLALAGTLFFLLHVIVAKSALFMISGVVRSMAGNFELKKIGGLYKFAPFLSIIFLLAALSLAGIPPLSGFWAKLALIRSGLESQQYLLVAVSLIVGALTLFSMTKIWSEAFWKPHPNPEGLKALGRFQGAVLLPPALLLSGLTLLIGLAAGPIFDFTFSAAQQLLDPAVYIQAVLAGGL